MSQPDSSPTETRGRPPLRFGWRRLLRFQLRSLLIAMLLVAVALGWWSHRARRQRAALAAFKPMIEIVWYDFELDKNLPRPTGWLVDALGVDYFANVTYLSLAQMNDASLAHVNDFTGLEKLVLEDTLVTDEGLKQLGGLSNLKLLSLRGTLVTDAAIPYLERFRKLNHLHLGHTKVTDAGLKDLAILPSLCSLSLDDTQVSDAGMVHLENLQGLTMLDLGSTQITDEGIKHLASLPRLEVLFLEKTRVTDAGLVHLERLRTLKTVDLCRTSVTAEGVSRLTRASPSCSISHPYRALPAE